MCKGNVEIHRIKVIDLFPHCIQKVNLETILLGSEYCIIYQNLQKIVHLIKSRIVGHLSIITFWYCHC